MESLENEIAKWLTYNPDSGDLIWKEQENPQGESSIKRFNTLFAGKIAGYIDKSTKKNCDYKRLRVTVRSNAYCAHNICWFLYYGFFPSDQNKIIDHIDGDATNNRIDNLRLVSNDVNLKNAKMYSSNTSGHPGVNWHRTKERWVVRVCINKKRKEVGSFKDYEEAVNFRKSLEKKYDYHENHGRN